MEKCPHCGHMPKIEVTREMACNRRHRLTCNACQKLIMFTFTFTYNFQLEQAPCKYGEDRDHKWAWISDSKRHFVMMCEVRGKSKGNELIIDGGEENNG